MPVLHFFCLSLDYPSSKNTNYPLVTKSGFLWQESTPPSANSVAKSNSPEFLLSPMSEHRTGYIAMLIANYAKCDHLMSERW